MPYFYRLTCWKTRLNRFKLSRLMSVAQKVMVSTDANRRAFIRRYYNADAQYPVNYDLVLNTGTLSVEKAVSIIQAAMA